MMNWILLVMGGIAAIVIAMLLGGAMAPRTRISSRSLKTDRRADAVFALLRQADGPPRWCADLPNMRCTNEQPPREATFVLLDDDGQDIGRWHVSVETLTNAARSYTQATITESITVNNLLLRFLRSLGGNGARPQRYLEAVAAQLGESPDIHTEPLDG